MSRRAPLPPPSSAFAKERLPTCRFAPSALPAALLLLRFGGLSLGGLSLGGLSLGALALGSSACSATDDSPPPLAGNEPGGTNGGGQVATPGNQIVDGSEVIEEPTGSETPSAGGTNPDCDNILEVTYRDFTEDHPDFEMAFAGDVVRLNLVSPTLDAEGKPLFSSSVGCPQDHEDPRACGDWKPEQASITNADSFAQWYRTTAGVNEEFQKSLTLTQTSPGQYVYESDQFFPLGPEEGFGVSPRGHHMGENFLFTTEIHLLFTYALGQKFSFRGDDDLWIFINGKLALDLGSMHNVATGEIDFDAQAEALGIVPNRQYTMDVFHAERHTSASNFRIETNIACFLPGTPRIR